MKAVIYIRVSTNDQALGPEAQRASCQRWMEKNGCELVGVFADVGVSGAAPLEKCPGLLSSLELVKTTPDSVLLVAKRDRLSRDVVKAAIVEKLVGRSGGRVVSSAGEGDGNDAASALFRTIIDAFASYERALIGQRTSSALQVKKARGERVGQIPLGKKAVPGSNGKMLEDDKQQQDVISKVKELRQKGLKLRQVVDELNNHGIMLNGKKFNISRVHRIVQSVS